ncbi:HET-domain-containing protein [Agrocybe pediades]|nr:HET-domain-containing protein [Agrocybe pediades]
MKPSNICDTCWDGVVQNQFGILSSPVEREYFLGPTIGGYAYKISGNALQSNANQNCRWEEEVRVGKGAGVNGESFFSIHVNDSTHWFGYSFTTEDDPAASLIPGRNLYVDIGTEHGLALGQKLMDDCMHNHKECPSPSEQLSVLPTRVIDCSDPENPRLCIAGINERESYVILSYVWGEHILTRLTTSNLDAYKREIPLKEQPQTIQDAILTTHRLGQRYLWIDALCIIQKGDDDDKGRELQRMRSYYKDSYVAIIAASAPKVSAGFLQTRKDELGAESLNLPFVMPNGKSTGLVRLSSRMAMASKYEQEEEPVHDRGWCMQEFFLSPRELIFASHTLQYRCHNGTQNIANASNGHWISSEREPVPSRDLPKTPKTAKEKRRIHQAWKLTIENYSKRQISYSSDKLVAFASLAEEFSLTVQTPYYAGLWGPRYSTTCYEYRAPSWSWASLDGEINPGNAYFNAKEEEIGAEVKKCETTLKDPNLPFGEVMSGTLVLHAKFLMGCVMKPHWGVYHLREDDEPGKQGEWVDPESGKRMEDIGLGKLDSSDDDIHSGVRHVCVVAISRWADINPGTRIVQGLLVEPVSTGPTPEDGKTKYRRIGFFERSDDTDKVDEWFDRLEKVDIEII